MSTESLSCYTLKCRPKKNKRIVFRTVFQQRIIRYFMRIMFIRHGKVDMPWVKKYNSRDYDQAWLDYDTYDILPIKEHLDIWPGSQVIVTGYKRTHQTAEQFLGVKDYMIVEDLLDEVPLKSFMDTNIRFNRHLLNFLGRVEWYFPMKR